MESTYGSSATAVSRASTTGTSSRSPTVTRPIPVASLASNHAAGNTATPASIVRNHLTPEASAATVARSEMAGTTAPARTASSA
ncbi:MAG: hypothetical protein BWY85_01229 [Firmicutes bacterium ADurb.Bin506]|nr:MAG: hypothetical protein BWY85_01229 [Firmicutes bacterium ADurb.Bin506]